MITWMQRHKKWLIITIWISTIAFVGAGFVGWGAYDFGKSQGTIAKVADREISVNDLQREYSNMFEQYKSVFGESFTEEQAKNMGLENLAIQSLIQKNLYLSYADEIGITTTDEEVATQVMKIGAFQKNGKFDKETYVTVLSQNRTNPTEFEANLKDGLLLEKVKLIFASDINLAEVQKLGKLFFLEDTIKIEIIDKNNITAEADEKSLKEYYEKNKSNFKTEPKYKLSIKKIDAKNENELNATKEIALKEFIALKKGESKFDTTMEITAKTLPFSTENNQKIVNGANGDFIKPFVEKNSYFITKIDQKIEPQVMTFEEAKPYFMPTVIALKKDTLLKEMAAQKSNVVAGITIERVTRESIDKIPGLNQNEAGSFLSQLFSSPNKKGYILLDNKAVVYEVVESRFGAEDPKKDLAVYTTISNLKENYKFENLVQKLESIYAVKSYIEKDKN